MTTQLSVHDATTPKINRFGDTSTTLRSDTINDIDTTYHYALQQAVLLTMHRSNKTPASCTAEAVVKEAHKFLAFLSGLTEDTTPGELREARETIANLNRAVAHLERESADLQCVVEQLQRENTRGNVQA